MNNLISFLQRVLPLLAKNLTSANIINLVTSQYPVVYRDHSDLFQSATRFDQRGGYCGFDPERSGDDAHANGHPDDPSFDRFFDRIAVHFPFDQSIWS